MVVFGLNFPRDYCSVLFVELSNVCLFNFLRVLRYFSVNILLISYSELYSHTCDLVDFGLLFNVYK